LNEIDITFAHMITLYGIKNCDTMQKAFKWLDAHKREYSFHNYKELGIDKVTLELWLKHLPLDKLVNTKGTTYRGLTDIEKASITNKAKAIKLMISKPSLIKRPVWDMGNELFLLGFDENKLKEIL
jgi:arsenate reductase